MDRSFFSPMKTIRFVVVCLITVVAFSILINLGLWQLSRSEEKKDIEQSVIERSQLTPLRLSQLTADRLSNPTGFLVRLEVAPIKDRYLLLDNQNFNGKVGYLALQLMENEDQQRVLVERGFVPALSVRDTLPQVDWLSEPMSLEGRLYRKSVNPLSHDLHLEPGAIGRIQNLNFAQLEQQWGVDIEPFIVQPIVKSWPYSQPWQPVSMNSEKHLGYAVQWFSMAAVLALISLMLLIRTLKQGGRDD
ncbi:cytochrome oxidase biogenesis protein Surf1 facilitates heme A insertion [Vibrio galatheae]|uniref:SURF1-like protein n=1 Tax=Vibrio galatheae TaxID=579748 RepID=A0A0F4NNF9_9VIBR|nr:SURF1 family protein [Vibrio galatheae]KJY84690.1 cytochrome oxidase biogenesis protein Surf1 facilitates heme A insertion [Vibrio galatheae]